LESFPYHRRCFDKIYFEIFHRGIYEICMIAPFWQLSLNDIVEWDLSERGIYKFSMNALLMCLLEYYVMPLSDNSHSMISLSEICLKGAFTQIAGGVNPVILISLNWNRLIFTISMLIFIYLRVQTQWLILDILEYQQTEAEIKSNKKSIEKKCIAVICFGF
jgi:hypothetical protein